MLQKIILVLDVFLTISLADAYILNAMMIITSGKIPKDEKEVDQITSEFIAASDFSNCEHQRGHATAFVKAVLKEAFLKK